MEEARREQEFGSSNDVAPALLALHPRNSHVVVAVGSELRIFNLQVECAVVLKNTTNSSGHQEPIKAIRFNKEGDLFVSTGDDKLVKLWDTNLWSCLKTVQTNKKVSAASFSHDSRWLLFADKFGVVYTISTSSAEEPDSPVQLFAHCCSIITSLECCVVEGRFIITSDRDFKIRVSLYPKDPLKGAHEIEGFCLGHTSFVSCIALFSDNIATQFLESGGGDGMVMLWELKTTSLLDTFYVGDVADLLSTTKKTDEEDALAITCISVSKDGSRIAVGVESFDGVLFLGCDFQRKKLSFSQKVDLGPSFCPTSIQFDGRGWLWMVAGAAEKLGAGAQRAITRIIVISTHGPTLEVMNGDSLPGGAMLFETLEGDSPKSDRRSTMADAANATIRSNLSKRHYSLEYREIRKQMRNDRKLQRDIF